MATALAAGGHCRTPPSGPTHGRVPANRQGVGACCLDGVDGACPVRAVENTQAQRPALTTAFALLMTPPEAYRSMPASCAAPDSILMTTVGSLVLPPRRSLPRPAPAAALSRPSSSAARSGIRWCQGLCTARG